MKDKKYFNFENKVCLITGALGLLGKEFSRRCAESKLKLILVDIATVEIGEKFVLDLSKETGNKKIIYRQCDINDEKQIEIVLQETVKTYGKLDVVVNSAYPRNKNYGKKYEEVEGVDFDENVRLHLGGLFRLSKAVFQIMKKQKSGNIINIASIYGFRAPKFDIYAGTNMTMPVEYAAIKGAVINLNKYLAAYFGKYNIRVNCISPGGISNGQPANFVKKYSEKVPLGGRLANPEDIAGVLLFLISDASCYMTGQNIVVDGGWSL